MRHLFKEAPLEVVGGIVGVVVTVFGLVLSRESDWIGLAGTMLSIVGASLAAAVSASIFGSKRANDNFLSTLGILRNQLATSSGQISGALAAHVTRGESVETTLSRVNDGVGAISTVLNDMGGLLGGGELQQLDSEAIIQSKRDVVELGYALDELKSQVQEEPSIGEDPGSPRDRSVLASIEEMQAKVSEVLGALSRADKASPARRMLNEVASCPNCGVENQFVLGSLIGDSQMPSCGSCGERFHAHRGSAGVITNRPSSSAHDPVAVLRRHRMELPPSETRKRYLEIIAEAHEQGRLRVADDVTGVIDHELGESISAHVRMPLFFGLVDRDYGIIKLDTAEGALRDKAVVRFHDCADDDFMEHAEATWVAQALYRLWGYRFKDSDLGMLIFGSDALEAEQERLLERARGYARASIEGGNSEEPEA